MPELPARPTSGADAERDAITELRVSIAADIDTGRVLETFSTSVADWLGEAIGPDDSGLERYVCDLRLRVGPDRTVPFRKSAVVSLGQPVQAGPTWGIPIEWRAATLAPLFPVFVGRLTISSAGIAVEGRYAPPFGVVGQVLDRAVLAIVARGTAHWFLATAVEALTGARPARPAGRGPG